MRINLKTYIILTFVVLAVVLAAIPFFVFNAALERSFMHYAEAVQQKRADALAQAVKSVLVRTPELKDSALLALGRNALVQGLFLRIQDPEGREVFCMRQTDAEECRTVLDIIAQTTRRQFPGESGEYTERTTTVLHEGKDYGTVTIGYYGPFFVTETDLQFMETLNATYAVAAGMVLVIVLAAGGALAASIARPVRCLGDTTERIRQGGYTDLPFCATGIAELAVLGSSVAGLARTLDAQQRLKKRMARDYAHEFRTPLTALQSHLEGMLDGILPVTEERLRALHREALRLARMIARIDDIVALEDQSALRRESFDLTALARSMATAFEPELLHKQITVTLPPQPCMVTADKDKLSQVLANLLSNAVKYTDAHGHIFVRAEAGPREVCLTVEDNGMGIAAEDLPHIFEHLYRVDDSRTRNTGGAGIGLSIVRAIAEAHGGSVRAHSQPGHGTRISVRLPQF